MSDDADGEKQSAVAAAVTAPDLSPLVVRPSVTAAGPVLREIALSVVRQGLLADPDEQTWQLYKKAVEGDLLQLRDNLELGPEKKS